MADLNQLCEDILASRPLILASNRGPVEHQMTPEGRAEPRRGSGGIVTALNTLAQTAPFTWVSSAMGEGDRVISNNGAGPALNSPLPGHKVKLRYVVTPRRVYHKYFNVFCNPLLWFLQHYMWNPPYNPNVDASVHDAWKNGYIPVNQAFARTVVEEARAAGQPPVVMGHDYHLYLLPGNGTEGSPGSLDSALHSYTLAHAPLLADGAPLHHQRDLLRSVPLRHPRLSNRPGPPEFPRFRGRVSPPRPKLTGGRTGWPARARKRRSTSYPISINVAEVQRIAASPRATEYETRLQSLRNEVTIVRIDRAEPNKNVVRGFRAYELLLSRHPRTSREGQFPRFPGAIPHPHPPVPALYGRNPADY